MLAGSADVAPIVTIWNEGVSPGAGSSSRTSAGLSEVPAQGNVALLPSLIFHFSCFALVDDGLVTPRARLALLAIVMAALLVMIALAIATLWLIPVRMRTAGLIEGRVQSLGGWWSFAHGLADRI